MDFALGDTQQAIPSLAARVLQGPGRGPVATHPATVGHPAMGAGTGLDGGPGRDDGYDCALWKELGQAGPAGAGRAGWRAGTGSACPRPRCC